MPTDTYLDDIKNFDSEKKSILSRLGIRIGAKYFFMPNFLKKNAIELNALLWKIYNNFSSNQNYPLPKDGRESFISNIKMPETYWQTIGHVHIKDLIVRVDVFEKIFFLARKKIRNGPFLDSSEFMNPLGCNSAQLNDILTFCGFDSICLPNDRILFSYKKKINSKKDILMKKDTKLKKDKKIIKKTSNKTSKKRIDPNSPFAVLQKLL